MLIRVRKDPMAFHSGDDIDGRDITASRKIKYAIKRDLSGDVQFKQIGTALQTSRGIGVGTSTTKDTGIEGFNFFKKPDLKVAAFASDTEYSSPAISGFVKLQINGVTKDSFTWGWADTDTTMVSGSSTFTPATRTLTLAAASPNSVTLVLGITRRDTAGQATGSFVQQAQINDKLTVMI